MLVLHSMVILWHCKVSWLKTFGSLKREIKCIALG